MQYLCIEVEKQLDEICDHINNEIKNTTDFNEKCTVCTSTNDGISAIYCSVCNNSNENTSKILFKNLTNHVANALADYIINNYEIKILMRIINANYCYFNLLEKKQILINALKIVGNKDKDLMNSLLEIRRKNIIIRRLNEYFEDSNNLILDGFVNFRLKDYVKELEDVVDKAVDSYLMEREYKEFIRLLKYFVDIQDSKMELIHVFLDGTNKYILEDGEGKEITNECINEFINEISSEDVNFDDLLVSSLITLSPKKIIIHCHTPFKNKELLNTIKNVFCERVKICNICNKK